MAMNRGKRVLGVHEQLARLRLAYPDFAVRVNGPRLTADGDVQPDQLCARYHVRLDYETYSPPNVRVIEPTLVCRSDAERIPHMYGQERLCLYRPNRGEWDGSKNLATTIVPWASLWLLYYELWHATGEWLGGGEEPSIAMPLRGRRGEESN